MTALAQILNGSAGGDVRDTLNGQIALQTIHRLRRSMARGGVPVAMTTPPTITATNGRAATLTRVYAYNDPAINFLAATWFDDSANSRKRPVTADITGTGNAYTGTLASAAAQTGAIEFMSDDQQVEVPMRTGSSAFARILILNTATNRWEIAGEVGPLSSTTAVLIDSGTAGRRAYRIEGNVGFSVYGLRCNPTFSCWRYQDPNKLRGAFLDDSYGGNPSDGNRPYNGEYQQLGYRLGIDDWRSSSIGGTGLLATNSGASVNFLGRYVSDIINQGPFDVVGLHTSLNDAVPGADGNSGSFNVTQATANLGTILDAYHAQFPNAVVLVGTVPTTNTSYTYNANRLALTAAYLPVIAARPWATLLSRAGWITGTGYAGATTGDGNADRLIAADQIHPVQIGSDYNAERMAEAIRESLA